MPAKTSLADIFPTPDLADWVERATKDLRGRALDDLSWEIGDGAPVSPLATREDTEELLHLADGPRSWLGTAEGAWRIRELIVMASPEAVSRYVESALADGADEVEICFDELVRDGREPGDEGDLPGVSGVSIHTLGALRMALSRVDLASTHISLSAGEGALSALAMLCVVAEERGVPLADLRADVDFDPIARIAQRQAGLDVDDDGIVVSRFTSVESVYDEAAALVRYTRKHCPGVRPIAVDFQDYHLSGARAYREVACGLTALAETVRQLLDRGVDMAAITSSISLRVQTSHEVLLEIGKLRALRLLTARVLHAFGATDCSIPIHVVTSGRSRSYRYDLKTNLLRTTLASFAAIVGGCDTLAVIPYDEDPDVQDTSMRRLARHQQLLLKSESMLDAVRDPASGAFAIERTTDRLARSAWRTFSRLEEAGGLLATLRDGSLFAEVTADAESRTRDFATRRRTMVGINRFVDASLEGASETTEAAMKAADERVSRLLNELAEEHATLLRSRGTWQRSDAEDRVEAAIADAKAGATTGEITRARWPEDDGFRHRFLPIALLDGDEFEDLRDANVGDPMRVRLAPAQAPADRTAQRRLDLARSILQAGGFAVIESEPRPPDPSTSDATRGEAWARDVEAVVLACGDDDSNLSSIVEAVPGRTAVVGPAIAGLAERGVMFWQEGSTDWIDALTELLGEPEEDNS